MIGLEAFAELNAEIESGREERPGDESSEGVSYPQNEHVRGVTTCGDPTRIKTR